MTLENYLIHARVSWAHHSKQFDHRQACPEHITVSSVTTGKRVLSTSQWAVWPQARVSWAHHSEQCDHRQACPKHITVSSVTQGKSVLSTSQWAVWPQASVSWAHHSYSMTPARISCRRSTSHWHDLITYICENLKPYSNGELNLTKLSFLNAGFFPFK